MNCRFVESLGLKEACERKNDINFLAWAPFANVLLLAIGIILLSSDFLCPPGINLNLPKSNVGIAEFRPVNDVLTIDEGQRIFYKRHFISLEDSQNWPLKMSESRCVLIKADSSVSINFVYKIAEKLKAMGAKEVRLAISPNK